MIKISDLTKAYGNKAVFNRLNMNIEKNKISFLMGENGAGKTTLLKCLLKLEHFKGDILYSGEPLEAVRDQVHVIYDDSPFYFNLTGYQNINILLNKRVEKDELEQISQKFLDHALLKKKVKTYSYGQRKKLALMIAALNKPAYLFLDEISNGLDYRSMMELQEMINNWSSEMTIVAAGHQFEFYSSIVDQLFVLKDGSALHVENFKTNGAELGDVYKEYL
ncbi:ATP-binding cassette domain-containing protein [Bacillus swezeyi]|uniref:ABC transporter ATP-binding protein n=1 Tax=Bacillus swezeyi TaxID=1925020 RepID=A0A1R1S284_9BACI|nr:ATP-binding cassette domain-containing protein [Bacillus swezeyi]MEC1260394.1 ATP-binding cassette domain-containing protein [Bacillus swezeyi]MED1740797.1 ATP-binding cassette domain-containing protein [Bacillus swezeyi]MED2929497.1 ATP-binding cassette domain-containing protein [Bacillus swezeyi]MED2963476.1 ATP-binding cassette domain-containing protein [Bacillus swezeyi]MED2979296.1 ATP-binding cassette domain-containing protein [Bacillus swezeyi]